MLIDVNQHGAVSVIRPDGPVICQEDATQLRTQAFEVLGNTLGRFILDLTDMSFVDSYGLEALVDITDELDAGGQSLKICGISDTLREIMAITEITSKFQQFEDVQTAVRSFL